MTDTVVIKLSGRVFAMAEASSLGRYADILTGLSDRFRFVIVAGGGEVARHYIRHARSWGIDEATADEMGIDASRLNARMLIAALRGSAHPYPPDTLGAICDALDRYNIVVCGGLYPGQSTNGTAALIAEKVAARLFVNATDVEGVYDTDPRLSSTARLLDTISVAELRSMLADQGSIAGGYDLMDMVSLKAIERSSLPTIITQATPKNLEQAITGTGTGTRITHPG